MACRKSPFRLEKNNLFWTGFFPFRERKPPMAEKKAMEPAEEKVVSQSSIVTGNQSKSQNKMKRKFITRVIGFIDVASV